MRWISAVAVMVVVGVALAGPVNDSDEATLAFVSKHHPELEPLLARLRTNAPDEFAAAITDLEKARERIEKFHDRPERYQAMLAEWKLSSRIRLALAKLATSPSSEAESELRQLVHQRQELRLAALRAERDRLVARLEIVSEQINAYESDREGALQKELTALKPKQKAVSKGNRPLPMSRPDGKPPQPSSSEPKP